MIVPILSESELVNLAENTTLGRESATLGNALPPEKKPLIISIVLLVIAVLIAQEKSALSVAGIAAFVGFCFGGIWVSRRIDYNRKVNRYKWILWLFEGIGMVFRANLQDARDHYEHSVGNPKENIQWLRQSCVEIIVQRVNNRNQPCAIYNNIWAMDAIILVDDLLSTLGDQSLLPYASGSSGLMDLLDEYSMNGNRIADSFCYGQMRNDCPRSTGSVSEAIVLNNIQVLETQCMNTLNDPLLFTQTDAKGILDVLYSAAYANPPVSSDTYNRIQSLSQIAFGTVSDLLCPDAMLAHLIQCRRLSLDRANREINEARKWVDLFFKRHIGNGDFNASQFIYSFCGALKVLQLYDLERACLETAEKNAGVLDAELTARLDYLARGGGKKNDKVRYYSETKRTDTLPVDYEAIKMSASDIEWLFNEARGIKGNNAFIDYALAFREQKKNVTLPSSAVRIQGKSIADEIQKELGAEAKVSSVMVTALNNNETLQCLKIRTSRFPSVAYLLDISKEMPKIGIHLAVCWVPVSNNPEQQKQQCLSLWSRGAGEETAYMDNIFSAIENDIQRAIDQWNTSQSVTPTRPKQGNDPVYY